MRSIAGVDMNGVCDAIASQAADEAVEECELAVRSGFIRFLSEDERWIGGAQVAFAQHGRGRGWGSVGDVGYRVDVRDMFEALQRTVPSETFGPVLKSALPDLIGDADIAVFAVPDAPEYGELFRDRFLSLLRQTKNLRPLLLWRPVAALLGWSVAEPDRAASKSSVAVLSLMGDGLHASVLSVESTDVNGERLTVPQRERSGCLVSGAFRGDGLVERGHRQLVQDTGLPADEIRAAALAPWYAAIGAAQPFELVRRPSNRGWVRLPRVEVGFEPPSPGACPAELAHMVAGADVCLVEGPFSSNVAWRDAVLSALSIHAKLPKIVVLDRLMVARGCHEAARRQSLGLPIYFDFLPQLRINAMVGDHPQFVDLIAAGSRCKGGHTFCAEAVGSYEIGKGAERLSFWLFKEDYPQGRKAEVGLPVKADRSYPLRVSVEQVPGQGFAQIQISSSDFDSLRRSPITLDWTQMGEINEQPSDILAALEAQIGLAWPDVAVKAGHPFLWLPNHPNGSLEDRLKDYLRYPLCTASGVNADARAALGALAYRFQRAETPSFIGRKLGMSIEELGSFRALDSDGNLPASISGISVPDSAHATLDTALAKLGRDLEGLLQSRNGTVPVDLLGDIVKFGSWCFWRCPLPVVEVLLAVYEGMRTDKIHATLLRHGVARVLSAEAQLRRYFAAIARRQNAQVRLSTAEFEGAARALSTSEKAAALMERSLADRLLQETSEDIEAETRASISKAYKRRFKSQLLMLSALLRHRMASPEFLDPDGWAARRLLGRLSTAKVKNEAFAEAKQEAAQRARAATRASCLAAARRFSANAQIIEELVRFIHLEGRDPNIIRRIDALEDEEGEDDA